MSMNLVLLHGRLGRDPELRYTASGQPVCNFSMATSERFKSGDEWAERTEWHNIVVWGKHGEACAKYLVKGSEAVVTGKLQTRKWQDKSGFDKYTTEVVASSVDFVGSKQGGGQRDEAAPQVDDADIPF